jgi:TPR repeat protein
MRDLRLTLIFAASVGLFAGPVEADFDAGYRAFEAGNYREALAQLLPLADQQDAAAAYYVGLAYWDGRGIERNPTTAVSYLRMAAYREHAGAQLMLAIAYEYGAGVPKDYRLAAQWMRSAAEKGDVTAQYYLGRYYRDGLGVVQSDQQAYEWIRRSIELDASHQEAYRVSQDHLLEALLDLGAAAEWGRGMRQDLVEAYKWYLLASSYSIDDYRTHREAGRAMDAIAIRMSARDVAEARAQAQSWREARESLAVGR